MKKLGSLNKAAAWLIAAAMALIAVFGIGGLKLSSKYHSAEKDFNKAFTEASDAGSFDGLYASIIGYAEQIQAAAAASLGSDSSTSMLLARAIDSAKACSGDHAKAFVEADKLYTAVTSAYNSLSVHDPEAAQSVKGANREFLSWSNVIRNTYSVAYNEYIDAINDLKGGFPTSAIKALWGIGND